MQKTKTLVGLVIDVSGSMKTSIRNEGEGELSRFESFQRALNRLLDEARNVLKSRSGKEKIDSPIDLFIYCFGLKDKVIEVADLLTLMKMGDIGLQESKQQEEQIRASEASHSLSQEPFQDLERIARGYGRDGWGEWAREIFTYEQAQVLVDQLLDSGNASKMASYLPGGLAAQLAKGTSRMGLGHAAKLVGQATGLSSVITAQLKNAERFAVELIRQRGVKAQVSSEDEIRHRISQRIRQKIDFIGDTTLSIGELIDNWSQSDIFLQNFEDMIYSETPMCKALNVVKERFKRELSGHKDKQDLVLFLLSDGEPTDGDPLPIVREIKAMDVSIICCLIDNKDIIEPQILFNQENSNWNNNAKLMFEIASEIKEKSHFARFFLKKELVINSQDKMFVQLNHSKVLEEFIQIILSPLDQEIPDDIPRGD
jgi:von Willebrand factor type A domain